MLFWKSQDSMKMNGKIRMNLGLTQMSSTIPSLIRSASNYAQWDPLII